MAILLFQNRIQLSRTSKCIQFPWGGCGGNANNFISASQCQAACLASTTAQANPVSAATMQEHPLIKVSQDVLGRNPVHTSLNAVSLRGQGRDSAACHMQPEAGPCDQRLTRSPLELCLSQRLLSTTSDKFLSRWYFSQGKCQRWAFLSKVRVVQKSSGFNTGAVQATGTTLGA